MRNHWNTAALGDIASVVLSGVDKHILPGETPVRLCNYLDVYRNRRLTKSHEFSTGSAKQAEVERFRIQKGDVIITKDSETPDDIAVPCLIADDFDETICGYHLALIRPTKLLDSGFLSYLLQSDAAKRYFLGTATGLTRFGLGVRAIASFPIALPAPDEQAAIARVLDAVDTALERTRAALERVAMLRLALMQEFLPPWIGFKRLEQIPDGVESVELARDVADVCNGSTPSSRTEGRYWRDGTIPWLASGTVHQRTITAADEFVTEAALRECSISLLPPGTVLVGMIGQGRTRGMSAYMDIEACINQNFGAFVPRRRVFGKWLFYYFDFHYGRLREVGGGTNQGALNCFHLKRLRLPLPKLERQEKVAAILDGVENLERRQRAALSAREQLKKSLMHDLLTGRVRVKKPKTILQ